MLPFVHAALAATEPPPVRMKATLPGVPSTAPYEYYSGFLDAGVPPSGRGKMYFHYICAMSPDWEQKPMTLWYNGGPGAPSTYGLFQEFGPFLLSDASYATEDFKKTGLPTPLPNRYTWANVTSLCEIDSPAPMGASFCTEGNGTAGSTGGPSGDAYSCGPWTDLSVAAADHQAHIAFFTKAFPELVKNKNPVTIVGESCALASPQIVPHNAPSPCMAPRSASRSVSLTVLMPSRRRRGRLHPVLYRRVAQGPDPRRQPCWLRHRRRVHFVRAHARPASQLVHRPLQQRVPISEHAAGPVLGRAVLLGPLAVLDGPQG